jgi:hypothetical protein
VWKTWLHEGTCWENPKNKKAKKEKSSKEERFCNFCKKKGHTKSYCNKKRKEVREKKGTKGKQDTEKSEIMLIAHGEAGQQYVRNLQTSIG